MGARGRGSRALRLAWNVNYFILVFTVIGRGHDEPRSLHGEAEAQAVYKAGLRSKGKEVEPDSAGSREELGSLREQSLQAGGGEHGASRPDAPGTLGVMRDELTVYFPGATSLKSTIYHVTNWMAPNLVSSQSGDF